MSCFLLTVFSVNVFAWEGRGFKIISEKTEMTPGLKGTFVRTNNYLTNKNTTINATQAMSLAHDAHGLVNQNIEIYGQHSYYIFNNTSIKQRYHFNYTTECNHQFMSHYGDVDVEKGGRFQDAGDIFFMTNKQHTRHWIITATTKVHGESSDTHKSKATLTVTK